MSYGFNASFVSFLSCPGPTLSCPALSCPVLTHPVMFCSLISDLPCPVLACPMVLTVANVSDAACGSRDVVRQMYAELEILCHLFGVSLRMYDFIPRVFVLSLLAESQPDLDTVAEYVPP